MKGISDYTCLGIILIAINDYLMSINERDPGKKLRLKIISMIENSPSDCKIFDDAIELAREEGRGEYGVATVRLAASYHKCTDFLAKHGHLAHFFSE